MREATRVLTRVLQGWWRGLFAVATPAITAAKHNHSGEREFHVLFCNAKRGLSSMIFFG